MIYVRKASGEKQIFEPEKIMRTCLRAGADKETAERIAKAVAKQAYEGIATKKILRLTLKLLEIEGSSALAARYDLKGAIMRLGPAGYQFEILIGEILKEYGYKIFMPPLVKGACIDHEIDIIAEKNRSRSMVECKYRLGVGIYIGIKEALYTWARFLDLVDGYKLGKCPRFNECWLICNTKFSGDAIKYGRCKKMKLIGWHYPKKQSLERLIENKKLYPITALRKLDQETQKKLANKGLMLCRDLININFNVLKNITGLKTEKLQNLIKDTEDLLNHSHR